MLGIRKIGHPAVSPATKGMTMSVEQLLAALKAKGYTLCRKGQLCWLFQDRDAQIVPLPNPEKVDFDQRAQEYARWLLADI